MFVMPHVLNSHDEGFWISRDDFVRYFDATDFLKRDRVGVEPLYLDSWFYELDGKRYFILPVVQFFQGKTQFINGRHRVAVLLQGGIERLPIAFATKTPSFSERDKDVLKSWGLEPVRLDRKFLIPDFSIVKTEAS